MATEVVQAEVTSTQSTVAVTAVAGGAGQALTAVSSTSIALSLGSFGAGPVEYKVGADGWVVLDRNQGVKLPIDLRTTEVRLRKAVPSAASIAVTLTVIAAATATPAAADSVWGVAAGGLAKRFPGSTLKSFAQRGYGGEVVGYLGASITNGSSASGGSTSFVGLLHTYGTRKRSNQYVRLAYPGTPANTIATHIGELLALRPDRVVVGPDWATNAIAYADLQAATMTVIEACAAARVPLAFCKPIPFGSGASAGNKSALAQCAVWLGQVARRYGCGWIDTATPLTDPATGDMYASMNSGDNVHPNDAGHAAMAVAISAYLDSVAADCDWPALGGGYGLLTNPLFTGAGTDPTGGTGVGANNFVGTETRSLVARVDAADLPIGRWWKVRQNATGTAGGNRTYQAYSRAGSVIPGNWVLAVGCLKKEGSGQVRLQVMNGTTGIAIGTGASIPDSLLTAGGPSVKMASVFQVPAGCSALHFWMTLVTAADQDNTGYFGGCDIIDLTAAGLV